MNRIYVEYFPEPRPVGRVRPPLVDLRPEDECDLQQIVAPWPGFDRLTIR